MYLKISTTLLIAVVFQAFFVKAVAAQSNHKSRKISRIPLTSLEGKVLLQECEIHDYVELSMFFECQANTSFCGPASIAMVLNSLGIARPESSRHPGYSLFDQENVFALPGDPPKSKKAVRLTGMSLETLSSHFQYAGAQVEQIFASESNKDEFRTTIAQACNSQASFVVVNYSRSEVGQDGGGHISPVAAFHKESDQVLILDVSKYKYPPCWIKTSDLFRAISTLDREQSRGFVIVSANAQKADNEKVGKQ